jgi:hypothetical protein
MRGLRSTNLLLLVISILLCVLSIRGRQGELIASANAQTGPAAVYLYGCYENSGRCNWTPVHVTEKGVMLAIK